MEKERKNGAGIAILGILAVLLLAGGVFLSLRTKNVSEDVSGIARISSFDIAAGNFFITSSNLASVAVWYIPTGTGIEEKDYQKIGAMILATSTSDTQVWTLPIPKQQFLAAQIFAEGKDSSGGTIRMVLPYQGATEIHDALWGPSAPADNASPSTITLKIGEQGTVSGITLKLLKITEDSRCPADVTCIWAGRVVADFDAVSGSQHSVLSLSTDKTASFAGFDLSIADVVPPAHSGTPSPADYALTVSLISNE